MIAQREVRQSEQSLLGGSSAWPGRSQAPSCCCSRTVNWSMV